VLYRLLHIFFSIYLRGGHRLVIKGAEHIPADGPAILCANHTSYFDSMLVGLCTRRRVRFMIDVRFVRNPLLGFFIRRGGAIPVNLTGKDKEGMKEALDTLANGRIVALFPEGRLSRTGLLSRPKPGAAYLSMISGAPLVPISIAGAFHVYRRGWKIPRPGKIAIRVHSPLHPDPTHRNSRHYRSQLTDLLMARIRHGLKTLRKSRKP
jgi:1-acyl-sn-glycerol-3-phosphate acyltransferase